MFDLYIFLSHKYDLLNFISLGKTECNETLLPCLVLFHWFSMHIFKKFGMKNCFVTLIIFYHSN